MYLSKFYIAFGLILLLNACILTPSETKTALPVIEVAANDVEETQEEAPVPKILLIKGLKNHIVQDNDTLHVIAELYDCSMDDLIEWNNLKQPYTITPATIAYLQVEPSDEVVLESTTIPVTPNEPPQIVSADLDSAKGQHTVQKGETLKSIAKQYNIDPTELGIWNKIEQVTVDQILTVQPPEELPSETITEYHTVLDGDTVANLARNYNITEAELIALNNLQAPYELSIGQSLHVTTAAPSFDKEEEEENYMVVFGDSLSTIATQNGYNAEDLAVWNNIKPPYKIKAGQTLRLSPPPQDKLAEKTVPIKKVHHAKGGESLEDIAELYNVSLSDLAKWNEQDKPYNVYPGLEVTLTAP